MSNSLLVIGDFTVKSPTFSVGTELQCPWLGMRVGIFVSELYYQKICITSAVPLYILLWFKITC